MIRYLENSKVQTTAEIIFFLEGNIFSTLCRYVCVMIYQRFNFVSVQMIHLIQCRYPRFFLKEK